MLPYPGLLGSLVAADMRLPLKPEFMAKLGTTHGQFFSTTNNNNNGEERETLVPVFVCGIATIHCNSSAQHLHVPGQFGPIALAALFLLILTLRNYMPKGIKIIILIIIAVRTLQRTN